MIELIYVAVFNYGGYGRIVLGVFTKPAPAHQILRDTLDKRYGPDGWELSGEQYIRVGTKVAEQVAGDVTTHILNEADTLWIEHFDEVKRRREAGEEL